MDREGAKEAYTREASELLQQGTELVQKNWEENEGEVKQVVFQALQQLLTCNKDKPEICYIQISLLRSQMDDDIYRMLLSLHDGTYFLDSDPRMQTADISSVFSPLRETRARLYQAMDAYRGKIENFDADRMIRETAMAFYKKKADSCRMLFRDLEQWRAEKGLMPWNRLTVKWGGYQEESETVYLMDTGEKKQSQFLAYNERNSISQWDPRYVYQSWETASFADMEAEKMNLLFLVSRNCGMERCQWKGCMMHGGAFRGAKITETFFAGCDMSGCDFRDVEFSKVQFVQCNLMDADFTGAKFDMIQFPGSQMNNAKFSRDGICCNGLDACQLQQIRLEEEPYVF